MTNAKYVNHKFGRLTVLEVYRKNSRTYSLCKCDCGNIKEFLFDNVRRGLTQSCKCLNREVVTKHGQHGTKVYAAWQHMIRRCLGDNEGDLRNYVSKGIKVCKPWLEFKNFYKDMGDPPTKSHSLDRVNGGKGYSKSNCRWATPTEQARNTSRNRYIEHNGQKKCLFEWAHLHNIQPHVLTKRLKLGWDMNKALTTPVLKQFQRFKK